MRKLQGGVGRRWSETGRHTDPKRPIRPLEKFVVLHEYSDLEERERLLLRPSSRSLNPRSLGGPDIERRLSHDYIELFRRIFANEEDGALGRRLSDPRVWYSTLGLDETRIRTGTILELSSAGSLLNRDNERNVALRAKTVFLILTSFRRREVRGCDNLELG